MSTVLFSDIASDLGAGEIVSTQFLEKFNGPDSILQGPWMVYGGSITGSSTDTINVPHVGLRGNAWATVAEGSDLTDSALDSDKSAVSVGRVGISYTVGDLMRTADRGRLFTGIVQNVYSGYTRSLLQKACNVIDGFTLTQTASTTLTADDLLQAKAKLGAVPGPRIFITHSKSFGELERDIGLTGGGGHQFNPATLELINKIGSGYVGEWAGLQIFVTDDVISAGSKRQNAILAPGALCWADGEIISSGYPNQLNIGNKVVLTEETNAGKFQSRIVANGLLGVSMGMDAAGVTVKSAA